jgi:hypothetical protein
MRMIDVWFLFPRGREKQQLDLLRLIRTEAEIRLDTHKCHGLPECEALNRILGRGSGDDGFFPMTWEPFAIDESEYCELRQQFDKL